MKKEKPYAYDIWYCGDSYVPHAILKAWFKERPTRIPPKWEFWGRGPKGWSYTRRVPYRTKLTKVGDNYWVTVDGRPLRKSD